MNITDMLKEGMKSMKLPAKDEKSHTCCPAEPMTEKGPRYPYGLELRLDEEVLKLCNKKVTDFALEQKVTIVASATVEQIRSSIGTEEYQNNESVELQITDMKFVKKEEENSEHNNSEKMDY